MLISKCRIRYLCECLLAWEYEPQKSTYAISAVNNPQYAVFSQHHHGEVESILVWNSWERVVGVLRGDEMYSM